VLLHKRSNRKVAKAAKELKERGEFWSADFSRLGFARLWPRDARLWDRDARSFHRDAWGIEVPTLVGLASLTKKPQIKRIHG
jgi:hypothetical protein